MKPSDSKDRQKNEPIEDSFDWDGLFSFIFEIANVKYCTWLRSKWTLFC